MGAASMLVPNFSFYFLAWNMCMHCSAAMIAAFVMTLFFIFFHQFLIELLSIYNASFHF